jgi:hypothetical protein
MEMEENTNTTQTRKQQHRLPYNKEIYRPCPPVLRATTYDPEPEPEQSSFFRSVVIGNYRYLFIHENGHLTRVRIIRTS